MTRRSIPELFDLTGMAAIVTGGALGIGRGIAERLAEAGAHVLIADVNREAADKTAREISISGGSAEIISAEVGSAAEAERIAQAAMTSFGRVDILVNNAGIFPFRPALRISEEEWDNVLSVNLRGMFFCSQAAAKRMIEGGRGGKIVNIASVNAMHPSGAQAHYDASKGGVVMLAKSLALEFARFGINVNTIAPGGISTHGAVALVEDLREAGESSSEQKLTPEARRYLQGFEARVPLGRVGEPDEIAKVALFLVSGASDYMTGSTVLVDGGVLLS